MRTYGAIHRTVDDPALVHKFPSRANDNPQVSDSSPASTATDEPSQDTTCVSQRRSGPRLAA